MAVGYSFHSLMEEGKLTQSMVRDQIARLSLLTDGLAADLLRYRTEAAGRIRKSQALLHRLESTAAPAPPTMLVADKAALDAEVSLDIAAITGMDAVPIILDLVCRTTKMRFAAVARVTEGRWIACSVKDDVAFGLKPGSELKVETTICHEIRQSREAVVISNVSEDPLYHDHPTPALYGFQSCISVPIIKADGQFFGTLCAIDPRPTQLNTPDVVLMFKAFAASIASYLSGLDRMAAVEARLNNEIESSLLREQFIAALGHDLRNPLMAISSGTELLAKDLHGEKAIRMFGIVRRSVIRISTMIEDLMDFARGRLGSGMTLDLTGSAMNGVLTHVVDELRVTFPDRAIESAISANDPLVCDPTRIAQLFSNLLSNAISYGATDLPIKVQASTVGSLFELSVSNGGDPIPPATLQHLFEPYRRGVVQPNPEGLGLGLFIASEIARAHGGSLDAKSSVEGTCFTFRMPMYPKSSNEDQS